jgi:hypothetical protein
MRLRVLMVIIAVMAVGLGVGLTLHRRSTRLSASALAYGREASRLENRLEQLPSDEVQPLLDRVHWNDSVAEAYRRAASRPWIMSEPDPDKIACQCSYHAKKAPTR